MKASVVIPTFNRLAGLRRVLDALNRQTLDGFEVVVVDNSSTDGTGQALEDARNRHLYRFPLVYHRKHPEGPAAARNVGMRLARSELVAFVDSDVELAPDWLAIGVAYLDAHSDVAAVGGKVLYANDREYLNAFGGELSRLGLAWDACEGRPAKDICKPRDVLWMNCSAAMMRKSAVDAVGGFDDRFFYAFEDSDLGWRLALCGWRQSVLPEAVVYHDVGDEIAPSSEGIVFHATKNRLASLIANGSRAQLCFHLPLHLAYTLADAALRSNGRAKLRALWWNLRDIRGTLRRRRQIRSLRQVQDRDLPFADTAFPAQRLNGMRRRPNRSQSVSTDPAVRDDRV